MEFSIVSGTNFRDESARKSSTRTLRLAFAKATGSFDELDLLSIVGSSQLGRIRYIPKGENLSEDVLFQSVDELLSNRSAEELYHYRSNVLPRTQALVEFSRKFS